MKEKFWKIIALFMMGFFLIAGTWRGKKLHNPWITGFPIATSSWSGLETWATTGTVDTLVISGIDTTFYIFVSAVDSSAGGYLYTDISRDGDTCFVRCSASKTADEFKYNWMVLSQ